LKRTTGTTEKRPDFSKTSQSGLVLDQTTNEWNKDSTRPDADGFDGGFFIEDEYKIMMTSTF